MAARAAGGKIDYIFDTLALVTWPLHLVELFDRYRRQTLLGMSNYARERIAIFDDP